MDKKIHNLGRRLRKEKPEFGSSSRKKDLSREMVRKKVLKQRRKMRALMFPMLDRWLEEVLGL